MTMEIIEIADSDNLLRRVPFTDPNYIKPDGTITSFAFSPRRQDTNGLSMDVEKLTTFGKSIMDRTKFRLYRLQAQVPRNHGLKCLHDPKPENVSHALIQGEFNKAISRKLASAAERVIAG
ncbi:MAG: hypothetical protein EPN93_12240 [Spirochaetes bacterium]|nr:MAG: hypothetical protein EPN93_12240 [Spirochaetota bacterium]